MPEKYLENIKRGQTHARAYLSDLEVELIRTMHEDEGLGYKTLAKKFEVPRETIRDICLYKNRGRRG